MIVPGAAAPGDGEFFSAGVRTGNWTTLYIWSFSVIRFVYICKQKM